ncbi:hypothetical protein ALC56_10715 [Trachymyrmex septentrionalis]|uniref:Uncharacterized protein n=1 Tax=Trachymyrmex septentrionalis TaxID=34720 RepID=A0A195F3F3_9HYME|nr:hypothetical protein ALC56_10715 [Trachymyrmex septentrionalis]
MRKSQRMWDGSKPEKRGSGSSRGREAAGKGCTKPVGLSSRRVMDRVSAEEDDIVKRRINPERQSRCIDNWLSRNTIDESVPSSEQPIEVEPNLADPGNFPSPTTGTSPELKSGRSSVGAKQPSATFEGSREETLPAYLQHRLSCSHVPNRSTTPDRTREYMSRYLLLRPLNANLVSRQNATVEHDVHFSIAAGDDDEEDVDTHRDSRFYMLLTNSTHAR